MTMQNPFVWGPNGQMLTPGQVDRLRDQSQAALHRGIDTSPVGHWTAGLARMVDGYGGGRGLARADAAEKAGILYAQKAFSPVIQALTTGAQPTAAVPMASSNGLPMTGSAQSPARTPMGLGFSRLFSGW